MIEILCIAAEITAVLLILSIAVPASISRPAKKPSVEPDSAVDLQVLVDCQESLLALRSFVYMQAAKSVSSVSNEQSAPDKRSPVIDRLRHHLDALEPLRMTSTIDSCTRLPNRQELEKLIEASSEWAACEEVPTWICLVQVDHLDQLDEAHGPMASELMLRHLSHFLRERIGGYGPIVRFNHSAFAVVLYGWTQEKAIGFLESVRADIRLQSTELGDSTLATTASASVARLDAPDASDELWERLEDGMVEAISAGANRGRWFDTATSSWQPMGTESIESTQPTTTESTNPESTDSDPGAFGADDIALLFQTAQTNKNSKESPPAKPHEPASVSGQTELKPDLEPQALAALEDDIAALFKAARAKKGPSLPLDPESDSPPQNSKTEQDDEASSAATNEDIESLFESLKR